MSLVILAFIEKQATSYVSNLNTKRAGFVDKLSVYPSIKWLNPPLQ
ncbi:hypothetical protein MC7420_7955 [Coleofasciculus chthonoplastes PCC 7420]|uniref:Uncharacterized protein n=1 Tax=Coleofasciculus chthonoplastes PCC 7420 TaxID=118168 RepID=B4VJ42_9CYAN|nr:hypothetical protein MC7420_7955 [Coleofasciculus chthonoplastes PCC 7420]